LPAIIEALGDIEPQVRNEACDCFVAVHPNWQVGIISCLEHANPRVRCNALEALGERGGSDDRVGRFPDAVVSMLDDSDERVRVQAAISLTRLGRGSDRVLELLRYAIEGSDSELRTSACSAVGKMGAAAAAAVPDLLRCLGDSNEVVRRCAASSLASIDPIAASKSKEACAIFVDAVERGGMPAVFAAQALGKLGPAAPDTAITVLERATTSDHAFVRDEAKGALKRIRAPKEQ
jgi:HEAT repeat protein